MAHIRHLSVVQLSSCFEIEPRRALLCQLANVWEPRWGVQEETKKEDLEGSGGAKPKANLKAEDTRNRETGRGIEKGLYYDCRLYISVKKSLGGAAVGSENPSF